MDLVIRNARLASAPDAQPIDIQARSLDATDAHRQLRFWLKPDQSRK